MNIPFRSRNLTSSGCFVIRRSVENEAMSVRFAQAVSDRLTICTSSVFSVDSFVWMVAKSLDFLVAYFLNDCLRSIFAQLSFNLFEPS